MSASQGDYLAHLYIASIPAHELVSEHAHDLWDKIHADTVRAYALGRGAEATRIIEYLGNMTFRINPDIWARDFMTLEKDDLIGLVDYAYYKKATKAEIVREMAGYFLYAGAPL